MIKVFLIGHNYEYEVKELVKLFYRANDIEVVSMTEEIMEHDIESSNKDIIVNKISIESSIVTVLTKGYFQGRSDVISSTSPLEGNNYEMRKKIKQLIKASLFKMLKREKNIHLPWGFLTGIRPTKIVHELIEKDLQQKEIFYILTEEYFISKEKAALLLEVAETEHKYVYPIDNSKVSIYISIPFCPTRCAYCSFPSNPLDGFGNYIDDYVKALCKEIQGTAAILKQSGKVVQTLYIGGGTPTTLNIEQFSRLFNEIFASLDLSQLKEFTVEAGRPDTINAEKLMFLKQNKVTRISINPQSMNECTLQEIGRNHSAKEIIESYQFAQEVGFENINMDIIIGLPGENIDMVIKTMEEIKRLSPTNLTVHTLAIKNASKLKELQYSKSNEDSETIKMLEVAEEYSREMGLSPYYMYRQKHMVGNLENIGYAKPGYECIYNIQIMEEKQTIIAMGAGAVSKIVFPEENRLERVPNVKNLEHYIQRVDEMIERKKSNYLKKLTII